MRWGGMKIRGFRSTFRWSEHGLESVAEARMREVVAKVEGGSEDVREIVRKYVGREGGREGGREREREGGREGGRERAHTPMAQEVGLFMGSFTS